MNRKIFFDTVRPSLFNGSLTQPQVNGMEGVLDAFARRGDGRMDTLAYAMATTYHETGRRMVPVREGFAATDAGARAIVAHRAYGKPVGPYGHVYYGRGQVQLTWHQNYIASSGDAGMDLERYPDAMLDPLISAKILIMGLLDGRWNAHGRGISYYLDRNDLQGARRTVNITDRWEEIAGYHRKFLAALQRSGVPGEEVPAPIAPPKVPEPDTISTYVVVGMLAIFVAAVVFIIIGG